MIMIETPVLSFTESAQRGSDERARLDMLIADRGGIFQYMQGPRYNPNDRGKEGKQHDDRRQNGHD